MLFRFHHFYIWPPPPSETSAVNNISFHPHNKSVVICVFVAVSTIPRLMWGFHAKSSTQTVFQLCSFYIGRYIFKRKTGSISQKDDLLKNWSASGGNGLKTNHFPPIPLSLQRLQTKPHGKQKFGMRMLLATHRIEYS